MYTWSKACIREKLGLSVGACTQGLIAAEIRHVHILIYVNAHKLPFIDTYINAMNFYIRRQSSPFLLHFLHIAFHISIFKVGMHNSNLMLI